MASGHTTLKASLLVWSAKLSNMLWSCHENFFRSLIRSCLPARPWSFHDSFLATSWLEHVSSQDFVLSWEWFRSLFSLLATLFWLELGALLDLPRPCSFQLYLVPACLLGLELFRKALQEIFLWLKHVSPQGFAPVMITRWVLLWLDNFGSFDLIMSVRRCFLSCLAALHQCLFMGLSVSPLSSRYMMDMAKSHSYL